MDVDPTDTVEVLKLQIFSLTGIDSADQTLFVEGRAGAAKDDDEIWSLMSGAPLTDGAATIAVVRPSEQVKSRLSRGAANDANDSTAPEQWVRDLAKEWSSSCSRVIGASRRLLQPTYAVTTGQHGSLRGAMPPLVCHACANTCFVPGQCAPVAMAGSDEPRPFTCACASRPGGSCLFAPRIGAESGNLETPLGHEVQRLMREAAQQQLTQASLSSVVQSGMSRHPGKQQAMQQMMGRMNGGAEHMRSYERPETLQKALMTIPVAQLHRKACEAFHREAAAAAAASASIADADVNSASPPPLPPTIQYCLLRELVHWFKGSFFKWTNNIPCDSCSSTDTEGAGAAQPTPIERNAGGAGMVELYRCKTCASVSRFPRYNNPAVLLDSRRGRCGEWANCFTLCALAMGFEARHVHDWTDHVWTEVFLHDRNTSTMSTCASSTGNDGNSPSSAGFADGAGAVSPSSSPPPATVPALGPGAQVQGRWVHVDSCEAAIDTPLVYEAGWGKKLSYVIAYGLDEVADVTRRYTKKFSEVCSRRSEVPEEWLAEAVAALDAKQRRGAGKAGAASSSSSTGVSSCRAKELQIRRAMEERELAANIAHEDGHRKDEESHGRISGSLAWRVARGEAGGDAASSNAASGSGSGGGSGWERHVSALPNHDTVTGGWQLLQPAPPTAATQTPIPTISHLTSWGAQLLAVMTTTAAASSSAASGSSSGGAAVQQQRQSLAWRGCPPVSPSLHALISSGPQPLQQPGSWKPLTVNIGAGASSASTSDAPASLPQSWPPADHVIASVAAEPKSLRLFVATRPSSSGTDGQSEHQRQQDKGRPSLVLWLVQPSPGGGKAWAATSLGRLPLPTTSASASADSSSEEAGVSMAICGGALYLLLSGRLYVHRQTTGALAQSSPSASATAADCACGNDDNDNNGTWIWILTTSASRDRPKQHTIHRIASTASGILIGHSDTATCILLTMQQPRDGLPAAGASCSQPRSVVVAPVHHAAGKHAGIELSFRQTITWESADSAVFKVTIRYTAAWRPTHTGSSSSAPGETDWLCLVRVGQTSESAVAGCTTGNRSEKVVDAVSFAPVRPAPVPPSLPSASTTGSLHGVDTYTATFPSHSLPTEVGIYELRYYRGPGFKDCAGVCAHPVEVVGTLRGRPGDSRRHRNMHASAESSAGAASFATGVTGMWAPLCPSSNVIALACGTANLAATAGQQQQQQQVQQQQVEACYVVTSSHEVWGTPFPRCFTKEALALSSTANVGGWCSGDAASSEGGGWWSPLVLSHDQLLIAGGTRPAADSEKATELTASGRDTGAPTAAAPSSPATAPAAASAQATAGVPTLQQWVAILFKQLTVGCGRTAAAAPGAPCSHPHCASNPTVGPQQPNAAAAKALQLAASGAADVICKGLNAA